MGAHSARKTRPLPPLREHRKERKEGSWKRKLLWAVAVVLVIFTALVLIGAFVPPQKTPARASVNPAPPGLMTVTHGHVTAVVHDTPQGRDVTMVNTGTQPATASFSLTDLCVHSPVVAYNVATGSYSVPIGGIKVTIPPGQAAVYILTKE